MQRSIVWTFLALASTPSFAQEPILLSCSGYLETHISGEKLPRETVKDESVIVDLNKELISFSAVLNCCKITEVHKNRIVFGSWYKDESTKYKDSKSSQLIPIQNTVSGKIDRVSGKTRIHLYSTPSVHAFVWDMSCTTKERLF